MYLAFIDESGTIQEEDPQCNYYVLTTMVMQEKGMKYLHRESQRVKKEVWKIIHGIKKVMPLNFEIHMKDLVAAKKHYKPLRGKRENTEEILKKIYDFISNLYITIISVVIVKKDFYTRYKKEEFLPWALRLIIERINGHISIETMDICGVMIISVPVLIPGMKLTEAMRLFQSPKPKQYGSFVLHITSSYRSLTIVMDAYGFSPGAIFPKIRYIISSF